MIDSLMRISRTFSLNLLNYLANAIPEKTPANVAEHPSQPAVVASTENSAKKTASMDNQPKYMPNVNPVNEANNTNWRFFMACLTEAAVLSICGVPEVRLGGTGGLAGKYTSTHKNTAIHNPNSKYVYLIIS